MTGCLLLFTREKQASHNQNSCRILRLCPKVSDLPRVYWVVNELAGSTCTKPDKWAFLIALSRGIVFLVPNLRRAFHDEESRVNGGVLFPCQRPIWFDPVRPLAFVAIGFCICSKANKFLALKFRAFHAGPGSPSQQAKPSPEDYAAESSTVCTDEALITFRYFLKPHWSDFRYMLCQDLRPVFKSTWLP